MGYSSEAVIPFMGLPNLRSLSVRCFAGVERGHGFMDDHPSVSLAFAEDEDEDDPLEFLTIVNAQGESRPLPVDTPYGFIMPPKCSSITEFKFGDSVVDITLLNDILALSTQLESFEYEMGGANIGDEPFIPRSIVKGLHAQASTLKRLVISTGNAEPEDFSENVEDDDHELGSLTQLTSLQHLEIPLSFLIRHNDKNVDIGASPSPLFKLLPRSLVHLGLELTDIWPLDEFLTLAGLPETLQEIRKTLPALRTIIVNCVNKADEEASQRLNAQWQKRDADGVQLEIRYVGST